MIDPLNIEIQLNDVETTLPLLPEGDTRLQISESAIVPNANKDGYNWRLVLRTTEPATATDGRTIAPNFPQYYLCALQAREDSTDKQAFMRSLGEAIDAIFQSDKATRPAFNAALVQQAIGRTVKGTIIIDTWQGNQNNKVRRLKKDA